MLRGAFGLIAHVVKISIESSLSLMSMMDELMMMVFDG